jgi:hypothetical protein
LCDPTYSSSDQARSAIVCGPGLRLGALHDSPFWSDRLGRVELNALQVSSRGGELRCKALGERVEIAGRCDLVRTGTNEV